MAWPTSNFPTSLDVITDKADNIDDVLAADINGAYDCIEKLEAKVGVNSSAVTTSLDYKVTNASSSNPGHKHTLAAGATDVTATAAEVNKLSGFTKTTAELNAACVIDAAAGTGSLRTLGTAATAACAGNDARLSDTRAAPDNSITTAKLAPVGAGTYVLVTSSLQRLNSRYYTWEKLAELVSATKGTLRIAVTYVGDGYWQVYRNGVAVGAQNRIYQNGGTGGGQEDISGWTPGDLLQIYAYSINNFGIVNIYSVTISCNIPYLWAVNL